jgi:hypothetical protein
MERAERHQRQDLPLTPQQTMPTVKVQTRCIRFGRPLWERLEPSKHSKGSTSGAPRRQKPLRGPEPGDWRRPYTKALPPLCQAPNLLHGREFFHELDRLEEQMRGAIAPHRLEFDEDAPVGPELHAVLDERGAEEVAAGLLEAGANRWEAPRRWCGGRSRRLGLARAAGGDMTEVRLVAKAADAAAGAGPVGA